MRIPLLAAAAFALVAPPVLAQGIPADLNTWSKKGPANAGTWTVSQDGSTVLQTTNGNPTFFVSPDQFFNTTTTGTFGVETAGDDDYIGFVFGYQSPQSTGTDYDFFLFTWKQSAQGDPAGFYLADVNCGNCLGFNFNTNANAGYDLIASDTGVNRGWADNTVYNFELLYTADSIRVDISGGTFADETIFAVDAADVGVASFASGQFGFFNYSQSQVRYSGFVQNNPPVAVDDGVTATEGVPETFNVLLNDADADDDPLTIDSFTQPAGGTLVQQGDSSFTYTASIGTLSDSFTYTITDGDLTSTATVTITVDQLPPPPGGLSGSIAAGTCSFPRPSPTSRCFPQITGTNNGAEAQRFTVFFRIEGTGGLADGFSRVTSRGEIKLGPGQSASSRFPLRTKGADPDGDYDLVLLAEPGSVPAPSSAAVELDRFAFTKGGAGLRAEQPLAVFPNPATDAASLRFGVREAAEATLVVYDALGREVARPVEGVVEGAMEVALDASALPAGLYVARLMVEGGETETIRFSVVR
jgi:hypothetical protein